MQINEKLILVDVDDVLLDWTYGFTQWMVSHGYKRLRTDLYDMGISFGLEKDEIKELIGTFNESAYVCFLTPMKDSVKYVRKLYEEHGFVFKCITAMDDSNIARKARKMNLENVFGKGIFEEIIHTGSAENKYRHLEKYKDTGCIWVEDKPENAVMGSELGLNSILIEHDHNCDFYHGDIAIMENWKSIYHNIT